jgi:hypothetical protein
LRKRKIIPGGGILGGFDAVLVLLFVSMDFVVDGALAGGNGGDTKDDGGSGDRGAGVLVLSVNCTGNVRFIGTGVGRDIDSIVLEVVVVEELDQGD